MAQKGEERKLTLILDEDVSQTDLAAGTIRTQADIVATNALWCKYGVRPGCRY